MDNPIVFSIAPVVASRARVTRWATYFPKKYATFREEFAELLADYKAVPVSGLLSVRLDFYVQLPKSMSNNKYWSDNGRIEFEQRELKGEELVTK